MSEEAQEKHLDLIRFVVSEAGQFDVFVHPMLKQINPHQRIRIAGVVKTVGEQMLREAVEQAEILAEELEKGDG
jgi:hypothetical protein